MMKSINKKNIHRGLLLVLGILVAICLFISGISVNDKVSQKRVSDDKLLYTPLVYKILVNS